MSSDVDFIVRIVSTGLCVLVLRDLFQDMNDLLKFGFAISILMRGRVSKQIT